MYKISTRNKQHDITHTNENNNNTTHTIQTLIIQQTTNTLIQESTQHAQHMITKRSIDPPRKNSKQTNTSYTNAKETKQTE